MSKKNSKRRKQTDPELTFLEQDENYYFIAGYTSGGAPYGITWEEAAEHGTLNKGKVICLLSSYALTAVCGFVLLFITGGFGAY